jgi:hypothetical protein
VAGSGSVFSMNRFHNNGWRPRQLQKRSLAFGRGLMAGGLAIYGIFGLAAGRSQTIISDPVGDTRHADIVSVSAGCTRSNFCLAVAFATGTLNPTNLAFFCYLDTDRNTNTSISIPRGTDVYLKFNSVVSTTQAAIIGAAGTLGNVPVTFGSNSLRLAAPLLVLGNTNGVMNFAFGAGYPTGTNVITIADFVPGGVWPPGSLVGPTTPILELKLAPANGQTVLSWTAATVYVLETAASLSPNNTWTEITNVATTASGEYTSTNGIAGESGFYRLRK